jgi:tetratricopeptide (TPR) repeat protein
MARRSLPAILIAAAALMRPDSAAAQADPAIERARSLYEKGQRQYELGHFADARQLFESAYEAKAAPALLFNIAQCHRKLGDLRNAASLYTSFLRADPENRSAQLARDLLQEVEEALQRDSSARPAPPEALPTAMPTAMPVPQAGSRVRWPAMVAGGTAGALLAVAVVESFGARSATNRLAQLHEQGTVAPADDARLRSEAESRRSRATVLYVVSAVAAAAGVGLWFAF